MARSEYSEYVLHVCSHMRLVCYCAGVRDTGWHHISKDGTLEIFGDPCQASIHRIIDFEWPRLDIGKMLVEHSDEDGNRPAPTPATKTLEEQMRDQ